MAKRKNINDQWVLLLVLAGMILILLDLAQNVLSAV